LSYVGTPNSLLGATRSALVELIKKESITMTFIKPDTDLVFYAAAYNTPFLIQVVCK
jgi:hypothetical protein